MLDARVLQYIDDNKNELIAVSSQLVEFKTPNPPGEMQTELAVWAREWLKKSGLQVELVPTTGQGAGSPVAAPLVLGSAGEPGGKSLCFQGHYDTVRPAAGWVRDPYKPVIEGGRLYGLGASDMKGGIAAMMIAAKALIQSKFSPKGQLFFLFTPDEEYPSGPGIRHILDSNNANYDWVINGEPSGINEIHAAMKGAVWGDITIRGKSAHGSTPLRGVNAFEHFMKFNTVVEKELRPLLKLGKSPYPVTPADHQQSTLVFGGIVKGTNGARSVVPDYFMTSFDIRTQPDAGSVSIIDTLKSLFARYKENNQDISGEVRVSSEMPSYAFDPNSPFLKIITECSKKVTGREPVLTCSSGAMETSLFFSKGISAVAYGPGTWQCAHSPDEFVMIDDIIKAAKVYALCAIDYLG